MGLFDRLARRFQRRQTLDVLHGLSDRQLADIGLSRSKLVELERNRSLSLTGPF